jgi:hypothetical protein
MPNRFENTVSMRKYVIVPKAKHAKASLHQISVAVIIGSAFCMLATVRLNAEALLKSDKIHDPRPKWDLAAEFGMRELA